MRNETRCQIRKERDPYQKKEMGTLMIKDNEELERVRKVAGSIHEIRMLPNHFAEPCTPPAPEKGEDAGFGNTDTI